MRSIVTALFFLKYWFPAFFYKSHRYYGFIPKSGDSPKFGIVKDRQYDIPFFPQWQNGNQLIAISRYEAVKNYFEDYKQVKEDSIAECFEPEHPVLVTYNLKSISYQRFITEKATVKQGGKTPSNEHERNF